ncbi:hypothetical protein L0F63_000735, partial [Massospora cicadina]
VWFLLGLSVGALSPTLVQVNGSMQSLDTSHILHYNLFAGLAYCKGERLVKFQCQSCSGLRSKFVAAFSSSQTDNSGYVAVDEPNHRIVLAFRGTSGIRNAAQDILAVPVPFDIPALGATVHAGFKLAMESLEQKFLQILSSVIANRRYSNYKLVVVGHSLGGAIASLAAIRIHFRLGIPWSRMELYTYGQPRTGNVIFARWFSQQPIGSSRVVYNNDIVPHFSPGALGVYAHHLNEVWIKPSNRIIRCATDVLEDSKCSYSVPLTQLSSQDHLMYYPITSGGEVC